MIFLCVMSVYALVILYASLVDDCWVVLHQPAWVILGGCVKCVLVLKSQVDCWL